MRLTLPIEGFARKIITARGVPSVSWATTLSVAAAQQFLKSNELVNR